MDISAILKNLEGCPCGRAHTVNIKAVEIGEGMLARTAEILASADFPRKILAVADKNTLAASGNIIEILERGGFEVKLKLYDELRDPTVERVDEIRALASDVDGILSIGTGTLNDICRRAALLTDREFAIFATAPSMDGFASGTAPIIDGGFKYTMPARQPSVIIADTRILAAAPAVLKAAGFGDIIGKFIALVDWRVAHLTVGEYYCENIASLVREALRRICSMADRVSADDSETAGAIMEILVFTGLAMKLAEASRPASGAEHMISHMIGMRKLAEGKHADFHGKKVGVATVTLCELYHKVAEMTPEFHSDKPDWERVYAAFGESIKENIIRENTPPITDRLDPAEIAAKWSEIARIIREELPTPVTLRAIMTAAGAATTYSEIDTDDSLARDCITYHPYMRDKIVLTRILRMTDIDPTSLVSTN